MSTAGYWLLGYWDDEIDSAVCRSDDWARVGARAQAQARARTQALGVFRVDWCSKVVGRLSLHIKFTAGKSSRWKSQNPHARDAASTMSHSSLLLAKSNAKIVSDTESDAPVVRQKNIRQSLVVKFLASWPSKKINKSRRTNGVEERT